MRKYAWTVVTLISIYIGLQLIADVAATKMVSFLGAAIPGGTFVYAITFTWRDALHKRLGAEWARAAIVLAGIINLVMALYFMWIGGMQAPAFVPQAMVTAWSGIFAFVPAIVLGSIFAEVASELTDTEIYRRVEHVFVGKMQFMRVVASNAVSVPLDSLLFASMAFVILPALFGGSPLPWSALPAIIWGQIIFKAAVTVVSLPLIYTVPERKIEHFRVDAAGSESGLAFSTFTTGEEV